MSTRYLNQCSQDREIRESSVKSLRDIFEKERDGVHINTGSPNLHRVRPGPLDLSSARASNVVAPLPGALATARIISNISTIQYPEGVSSPRPDLNEGAKEGKFRYDRDFLLQFMMICKEKPAMLPPLDAIGLEPNDQLTMARGGSGRHRQGSGAAPRQGSFGLGLSPATFNGKGATNPFDMGKFSTAPAIKLSSDDRFAASGNCVVSVGGPVGMQYANRPTPVARSKGGPGGTPLRERTRSKRGEGVRDSKKQTGGGGAGGQQGGYGGDHNNYQQKQQINLKPVAPLQATSNLRDGNSVTLSSEMIVHEVKDLFSRLPMGDFDSISNLIVLWINRCEQETDGRTLFQIVSLIFEKATDDEAWSDMYARLCRKMIGQISCKVQDDGIKDDEGKPITGGQLFRKYLLNRCRQDVERAWTTKAPTVTDIASRAAEDGKDEEVALHFDEYCAAQKEKRQCLGLIRFIGELFKLQVLTERIMHKCVNRVLDSLKNSEDDKIELLCKLLTIVGGTLDTLEDCARRDVYFVRMQALLKSQRVSARIQYMLQDLIELRERGWVDRTAIAAPQIHENHITPVPVKSDRTDGPLQTATAPNITLKMSQDLSESRRRMHLAKKHNDEEEVPENTRLEDEADEMQLEKMCHGDGSDNRGLEREPSRIQQRMTKDSNQEVVSSFLGRSVRRGMSSEGEPERVIADIVEDFAVYAPEALTKLARMIKAGLVA